MRKSYHRHREPASPALQYKINHKIIAPEVRLIDETGTMIGVVSLPQALERAAEAEMDLIEVSPKAEPPVCKIMDFGSFKYQKEKEMKTQKAKQKAVEIKGLRLSLKIGEHDLNIRLKQAEKFLADGDKVRIEMTLKGRERQHTSRGREIIDGFSRSLAAVAKVEQPFTNQGGKLSIIIIPKN